MGYIYFKWYLGKIVYGCGWDDMIYLVNRK